MMQAFPLVPKRPLGRTCLEVSVLGYGASPLGGVFGPVADDEAVRAVHRSVSPRCFRRSPARKRHNDLWTEQVSSCRAFELGVNFFDTSPFYGDTRSEIVLGKCLQGLPREKIVVCSKAGLASVPRLVPDRDEPLRV